jgi:plasmid stabilization system protein ParE
MPRMRSPPSNVSSGSRSRRSGGLAYEDRFFSETIRQRLFDSYKILFAIREDTVHVLHIRHQAQDLADLIA